MNENLIKKIEKYQPTWAEFNAIAEIYKIMKDLVETN